MAVRKGHCTRAATSVAALIWKPLSDCRIMLQRELVVMVRSGETQISAEIVSQELAHVLMQILLYCRHSYLHLLCLLIECHLSLDL